MVGRLLGVQVPLDAVDLSHVSILYTQGEMAAITPIYDYNFQVPTMLPAIPWFIQGVHGDTIWIAL